MFGHKGVEAVGRVCRGYRRDLEPVVSSTDAQGPKKLDTRLGGQIKDIERHLDC